MKYRKEIEQELSNLREMVCHYDTESEGLSLIERDILLERLRGIYTMVSMVPVENEPEPKKEEEKVETIASPFAPEEHKEDVVSVAQPILNDEKEGGFEDLFEEENVEEKEEEPEAEVEVEPEPISETVEAEEGVEPEPEPEPEPISDPEPEPVKKVEPEAIATEEPAKEEESEQKEKENNQELSLFDYLSKNQDPKQAQTIGDKFEQNHASVADNIVQQVSSLKVTDLRTVININDKFSFVGALFHNNMRAYTDFILRLNAIDNREEAIRYISEIAQQYSWNMDSMEVKTFNKILDRKF